MTRFIKYTTICLVVILSVSCTPQSKAFLSYALPIAIIGTVIVCFGYLLFRLFAELISFNSLFASVIDTADEENGCDLEKEICENLYKHE